MFSPRKAATLAARHDPKEYTEITGTLQEGEIVYLYKGSATDDLPYFVSPRHLNSHSKRDIICVGVTAEPIPWNRQPSSNKKRKFGGPNAHAIFVQGSVRVKVITIGTKSRFHMFTTSNREILTRNPGKSSSLCLHDLVLVSDEKSAVVIGTVMEPECNGYINVYLDQAFLAMMKIALGSSGQERSGDDVKKVVGVDIVDDREEAAGGGAAAGALERDILTEAERARMKQQLAETRAELVQAQALAREAREEAERQEAERIRAIEAETLKLEAAARLSAEIAERQANEEARQKEARQEADRARQADEEAKADEEAAFGAALDTFQDARAGTSPQKPLEARKEDSAFNVADGESVAQPAVAPEASFTSLPARRGKRHGRK